MENRSIFLEPTPAIDSDHPAIIELVERLINKEMSPSQRAVKLFLYVRDNCHYNMYTTSGKWENYKASSILQNGQGWCLQKAILLTALARAANIPSRLIIVSIRNHRAPAEAIEAMGTNVFFPHAYNHFFLNENWVKAAATFDHDICTRIGVPTVEFNGVNDAILPDSDLKGEPYIEYLEEYGYFQDLPWDMILENSKRVYGEKYKIWFE